MLKGGARYAPKYKKYINFNRISGITDTSVFAVSPSNNHSNSTLYFHSPPKEILTILKS